MIIGVLSDTHMRLPEEIPQKVIKMLSTVDLIIHAGDIVTLEVLEGLRRLGEVKAVCGNMDSDELSMMLPEREIVVADGKKIGITHGSGGPWGIENRVRELFSDVDVIIFGHTHNVKNEVLGGTLFFNPGQGKNSFGILTIGEYIKGEIVKI